MSDHLRQKLIPEGQTGALLGHNQGEGSTYGTYGGEYGIRILKEIIDKVNYRFSMEHLFDPKINPYLSRDLRKVCLNKVIWVFHR